MADAKRPNPLERLGLFAYAVSLFRCEDSVEVISCSAFLRNSQNFQICHLSSPLTSGSQWTAPGGEMVPRNEPEVKPVAKVTKRSTVKRPTAPWNRPVPPAMVFISIMRL